tara:strand:+ start:245 stop:484 length:240 start_codon:yes stop_codon:yes gene_type:complete
MNIEYILNDALNKAMCQKNRIQNPNSNKITDFVYRYLQDEKLTLTDVGCSSCECKQHSIKTSYGFEKCTKCGNEWDVKQ